MIRKSHSFKKKEEAKHITELKPSPFITGICSTKLRNRIQPALTDKNKSTLKQLQNTLLTNRSRIDSYTEEILKSIQKLNSMKIDFENQSNQLKMLIDSNDTEKFNSFLLSKILEKKIELKENFCKISQELEKETSDIQEIKARIESLKSCEETVLNEIAAKRGYLLEKIGNLEQLKKEKLSQEERLKKLKRYLND